jgi:hypothetical protein
MIPLQICGQTMNAQDVEAKTNPVRLRPAKPGDPAAFDAARSLFRELDNAGIIYCHFKSNAFLAESVAGRSDLDVLVDRRQAATVAKLLPQAGFRLFRSRFLTRYPSVEDHLACDPGTGYLIHLHLHYRLVVGARSLKAHELPWAGAVLDARVADPETGAFTSSPAHELFLLLVRAALKVSWLDVLRAFIGRPCIRWRTRQEFQWLCERPKRPRCGRSRGKSSARMRRPSYRTCSPGRRRSSSSAPSVAGRAGPSRHAVARAGSKVRWFSPLPC